MLGYIKGTVETIRADYLLLDNNGVGFRIFMPSSALQGDVRAGDDIKVFVHMAVREDAVTLFGFLAEDELELFRMLLNVSGVGPKSALNILSVLPADALQFAVLSEDAAAIAKAPGIGKKLAQKIILEMKDKIRLEDAFETKLARTETGAGGINDQAEAEAVQALTALGYSGSEALRAVRACRGDEPMDAEMILKAALRNL